MNGRRKRKQKHAPQSSAHSKGEDGTDDKREVKRLKQTEPRQTEATERKA